MYFSLRFVFNTNICKNRKALTPVDQFKQKLEYKVVINFSAWTENYCIANNAMGPRKKFYGFLLSK